MSLIVISFQTVYMGNNLMTLKQFFKVVSHALEHLFRFKMLFLFNFVHYLKQYPCVLHVRQHLIYTNKTPLHLLNL